MTEEIQPAVVTDIRGIKHQVQLVPPLETGQPWQISVQSFAGGPGFFLLAGSPEAQELAAADSGVADLLAQIPAGETTTVAAPAVDQSVVSAVIEQLRAQGWTPPAPPTA